MSVLLTYRFVCIDQGAEDDLQLLRIRCFVKPDLPLPFCKLYLPLYRYDRLTCFFHLAFSFLVILFPYYNQLQLQFV